MFKKSDPVRIPFQIFTLAVLCLLLIGLYPVPCFHPSSSVTSEVTHSGVDSVPFHSLSSSADFDDNFEALLHSPTEVAPAVESGLLVWQSVVRLGTFAAGVPFDHLTRPPPVTFPV